MSKCTQRRNKIQKLFYLNGFLNDDCQKKHKNTAFTLDDPLKTKKKNRLPDYLLYISFTNFIILSLLLCKINVLDIFNTVSIFFLQIFVVSRSTEILNNSENIKLLLENIRAIHPYVTFQVCHYSRNPKSTIWSFVLYVSDTKPESIFYIKNWKGIIV